MRSAGSGGTSAGMIAVLLLCMIEWSAAQCPAGKSSTDGNTNCAECPLGRFQDQTGQTTCKSCALGQFQDLRGQASCKTGDSCTNTQRINALATGCETCALRQVVNSGSIKVCLDCTSYFSACEKTNCDFSGVVCFDEPVLDMTQLRSWDFEFDEAWD